MVKISIISGFLGAGKTTFIKKMLGENFFGKHPILIENDYGSLNIDSQIMASTGVQVQEMVSGCICCSLIGNFVVELEDLILRQEPEHVIIEPSGIGRLSEILSALKELHVPYELYLTAAIIDATRFDYNNRQVSEYFWDQIKHAGILILSKTKKLSGQELSQFCTEIQENAPGKKMLCLPWEQDYSVILKEFCAGHIHSFQKKPFMRTKYNHLKNKMPDPLPYLSKNGKNVFESWSFQTDRLYSNEQIYQLLSQLNDSEHYGTIIRAKGILRTPDGGALVDYVPALGKVTSTSCQKGQIMAVGTNLNHRALEELFHSL